MRERWFELPSRGGRMRALELGPTDRPVDIVFSHANGFNARTYRAILEPLARTRRILCPDLRGHGRSELPAVVQGRTSWDDLRDDLLALLGSAELRAVVLSGHSMGATSSLLAAALDPGRIRRLVLFDPVLFSRAAAEGMEDSPMVRGALARRALFASREAAQASYRGRGAFAHWTEEMLADYLADGLQLRRDGQFELSCAPVWEASNYRAQGHDGLAALTACEPPVRILKAENGSTCQTAGDIVAGTTHFLPMERPDLVQIELALASGSSM